MSLLVSLFRPLPFGFAQTGLSSKILGLYPSAADDDDDEEEAEEEEEEEEEDALQL